MSNAINLPTKSEIERKKIKESEIITLNIYNNNITQAIDKNDQTEENLYNKDNYNKLIGANNNYVYYDNLREKSDNFENREKSSPIPAYYKNDSKVNPYDTNYNYQINNGSLYGEPYINNFNNEGSKPVNINRPIIINGKKLIIGGKVKKKKESKVKIYIVGGLLCFLFFPFAIVYCCQKWPEDEEKQNQV